MAYILSEFCANPSRLRSRSGKMGRTTSPSIGRAPVSLSRKRKKELRKLQDQANSLWESQQVLVGEAADVAREAGRQLGNYSREQVVPQCPGAVRPVRRSVCRQGRQGLEAGLDRQGRARRGRRRRLGAVGVGCRERHPRSPPARARAARRGTYAKNADKYGARRPSGCAEARCRPLKQGIGAGGVIAIILGVAAALGVLYAAWQTLRADDELWVADDPLRAPDA